MQYLQLQRIGLKTKVDKDEGRKRHRQIDEKKKKGKYARQINIQERE